MSEIVHPFGRKARALALIDPDTCTGCGYCSMFCIMKCIELQPDGLYKVTDDCIGCRSCKVNCFNDAITMIRSKREGE
ncbi:MAG: 4Fe-4S binding protein [Eubacteriales bacterium]|nr:4Fe-4S binding protein [Eubacteriales bacterium]